MMRWLVSVLLLMSLGSGKIHAQSELLKLTGHINLITEKIGNRSLMLYRDPSNREMMLSLRALILEMEKEFRLLARLAKDKELKEMLDFLVYSKDEIKERLQKPLDKDSTKEILDLVRSMLEGGEAVRRDHLKQSGDLEKNLLDPDLALEKLTGYYLCTNLSFEPLISPKEALSKLERIRTHFDIDPTWKSYTTIYHKNSIFVPNIAMVLTDALEKRDEK